MKIILVTFGMIFITFGCQSRNSSVSSENTESGVHEVIIQEVLQVPGYTYLLAKEGKNEHWLAVPTMDAKAGEKYYYSKGFEMTDFESRELKRTFKNILFLETLSSEPIASTDAKTVSPGSDKSNIKKVDIKLTPAPGGISISQLYSQKQSYSGKTVSVTGQVTKFSPEIMGKNWIHLQDGTEYNGSFDLVITSAISVIVGDTLTFEGKISLDKNLGYGYFYDVLMEDAQVK